MTMDINALMPHLYTVGRVVRMDNHLTLDWSLAKIELCGSFDRCTLSITASLGYGTVADLLAVPDHDFSRAVRITITSPSPAAYPMLELEAGRHHVAIYKANQARSGGVNLYGLTFRGILTEPPLPSPLRIQIIGDSISCGAGAVDNGREEGHADSAEYSYGALLARSLPADVTVTAVSGWGLACGGMNESALIPAIYEKTNFFRDPSLAYDFTLDQPDLVILALGTNDYRFASEGREEVLKKAAADFLARLRRLYPSARILWVYGQMLDQYHELFRSLIAETGDALISYLPLPRCVSGGFGHPDAEGHERYAALLAEHIPTLF